MPMNPEIKAEWVAALRDPNIRQTHGVLIDYVGEYDYAEPSYCCLGVLSDIAAKHGVAKMIGGHYGPVDQSPYQYMDEWNEGVLPTCVAEWAGLNSQNPRVTVPDSGFGTLTDLNDGMELSFAQIADIIEAQL